MKNKKIYLLGIILIIAEIMFIFDMLDFNTLKLIVKFILILVIVYLGFKIISRDKNNFNYLSNDYWTIFNDKKFSIKDNSVKIIKTTALFGNITLDFRNAELSEEVVIDNYALFGKVNLYVPDNVKIVNNISFAFGKYKIKYKSASENTINIKLKGIVLFGGVSVK